MASSDVVERSVIELLRKRLAMADSYLEKGPITKGQLQLWAGSVRHDIKKIYGDEHEITKSFSPTLVPENIDFTEEIKARSALVREYIGLLETKGSKVFLEKESIARVFIGHGRSPLWRELKDFLSDRLSLPWEEFNREAVAGLTTFERISEMLDAANFAFLIMTAEDQYADSTAHARQNVVHEVGLFQGRLGPKKAIILLEEGCSEFSNIVGLSQLRFPEGRISAVFEEIRRVLEREGVIKT